MSDSVEHTVEELAKLYAFAAAIREPIMPGDFARKFLDAQGPIRSQLETYKPQ